MPKLMMSTTTLMLTGTAIAAVAERQAVGFDDAPTGIDGAVKGVAMSDADAGAQFPVHAIGPVDMNSGAAIALGAEVSSDADGNPVSGGGAPFGTALNATTGPGQRVTVLIR